MAPGHLPGHSRKEGEGTQTEDDACDCHIIIPARRYLPFPLLFQMDSFTPSVSGCWGTSPLC